MVKNRSQTNKKADNVGKKKQTRVSKTPLAVNVKSVNRGAMMTSVNGVTIVSHREVVQEGLIANDTFGVNTVIALQPAISTYSRGSPLGTWLNKIASEYDNYEFTTLRLHYVPTCASTQAGLVILSVDPNPDAAPPDTFSSMKNAKNTVSGPVRERLVLDLMPAIGRKKLLTRDTPVTSYPLYDAGRAFIATTAGNDSPVGYVEIEYVIRLSNPQTGPRVAFQESVAQIPPGVYYSGNALIGTPGTQRWAGTTSPNAAPTTYMQDVIHNATYKAGYTTLAPTMVTTRTSTMSWVSPYSGITYKHTNIAQLPMTYWVMSLAGRYRFTAILPADWQNYATFGAELVTWGVAGATGAPNVATGMPAVAVDKIRNSSGGLDLIPSTYSGWRGLRSTVSGGTDDDDFVPELDITFVADVGERISLFLGVRNDTNIAENGDAWYLYDSRAGLPNAKLEFLGSV